MAISVPQVRILEEPEEPNLYSSVSRVEPNTIYKFKICLVGDGGTGKTTFINKVLNGDFISKYYATQGAVTKFLTLGIGSNSFVKYEVWDTAGQEKNVGLKDGYYIGAVAAFFFFDCNSRETIQNIPKHVKSFVNACGVEAPKLFVLANKIDVARSNLNFNRYIEKIMAIAPVELIQISARTGHNFKEPFEKLTRALFNDPNLQLSAQISLESVNFNYDIYASAPTIEDYSKAAADLVPDDN